MKDGHPFVGRKVELKQFSKLLADPAGKAILVSGSAAMGKSMLLKKMAQSAQAHPTLKCTCLDYQITPTDGVDSTMLEIVNDAADVVQSQSGKLKQFANQNKDKLSALFSTVGFFLPGSEIIGQLILSLAEQAKQGNARQQLKQMLGLLSEKLPDNGRMLFFIDPEKVMPDGSADAWRLVVKDLPDKILFIFAQRPEDILISDAYFPKLGNVYRVPQDTLEVFSPEDVETLIESRKSEIPSGLSEKEIRVCLDRYHGHPFSIQVALDLLIEGVRPDDLPNKAKPVEFAHIIIQTIERKGSTEALSFLEAAAIIEVPVAKEMVAEVAGLSEKQARIILADRFIGGLFRQEAKGLRIYHIVLADEILKRIGEKDRKEYHERFGEKDGKEYHGRVVQFYRQMLSEASEKQTIPDEIAVQRLFGHVLESEGRRAAAICFINECAPFLQRMGLFDMILQFSEGALSHVEQMSEEMAVLLDNIGRVYEIRGQLDKAEEMYNEALEINIQLGRMEGVADDYNNLENVYEICGQLDKAEEMYNKALEINTQLRRMEGIAGNYSNLGNVYGIRGQLDKAEEIFKKALKINKQLASLEGIANNYGNLGNVYKSRGQLDGAEELYRKSLEIEKHLGRLLGMAEDYGNLGILYQLRGLLSEAKEQLGRAEEQFGNAEEMFNKALEINSQLGRLEGIAIQYNNLGGLYEIRGQLDKAEAIYIKALEIDKQLGQLEGMANQYGDLGTIFAERGQKEKALEFWQKAKGLYEQLGAKHMVDQMQEWIEGLEGE